MIAGVAEFGLPSLKGQETRPRSEATSISEAANEIRRNTRRNFGPELEAFLSAMTKISPAVLSAWQEDTVAFINKQRKNVATSTDASVLARSIETANAHFEETGLNAAFMEIMETHRGWFEQQTDKSRRILKMRADAEKLRLHLEPNDFYDILQITATRRETSFAVARKAGGISALTGQVTAHLRTKVAPSLAIPNPRSPFANSGGGHVQTVQSDNCAFLQQLADLFYAMGDYMSTMIGFACAAAFFFPALAPICATGLAFEMGVGATWLLFQILAWFC
jgi:hypothetical protein